MAADLRGLLPDHFSVYRAGLRDACRSAIEDGRRRAAALPVRQHDPVALADPSTRTLLLPRTRTISPMNLQRGATEALIDTPAGALRVYSVHLDHVSADERIRQIAYLKERINAFRQEGGALTGGGDFGFAELPHPDDFVLMGDFNMEPEGPEYCALAGTRGRLLRPLAAASATPVDALARSRRLTPDSYSWIDPADHNKRMHLDYCFVSCGLEPRLKCLDRYGGRSAPTICPSGSRSASEGDAARMLPRRLSSCSGGLRDCSAPG